MLVLAVVTAVLTVGLWAWGGFHVGWSQNNIPEEAVDEVTGISHVVYRDGYRAGIDTLAIGGTLSILFAASAGFLYLRENSSREKQPEIKSTQS